MKQSDIHDVAKAVGVSISTVSRAFTRPELVSKRTRERVLQAADEMNFNISRNATTLKSGQTYRVALLMNEEITSWFNTEVFAGIESVMHPAGYDIELFQHIDTAEHRSRFFTELPVRRNVDAVFVASFAVERFEARQLGRIGVPIIGVNTPSTEGFDASVSVDDKRGMFIATQHLINLGHRHIVYTCSQSSSSINSSIDAREDGFREACQEACENGRDLHWEVLRVARGSDFAELALTALLELRDFPDAICCQMDMMAIPLVLKLRRYGHVMGRDYSIVSFDDSPYADTVELTTMKQDPFGMGKIAADKALKLIAGQKPDDAHQTLEAKLMLRGSDVLCQPGQ